ncbi:hypothetical protein GGQ96_001048 [Sphingomonas abaci]|uniref:Uncharacterized protein n=1 Tax=Sphingomonas abaci TaxID=237611 RepID=A0A7W7AH46_9SPHN|nr:hypothetical protein [Sphingomonas abaci]
MQIAQTCKENRKIFTWNPAHDPPPDTG